MKRETVVQVYRGLSQIVAALKREIDEMTGSTPREDNPAYGSPKDSKRA